MVKLTSFTGLCTRHTGSSQTWDVSTRLGLRTGSGKGGKQRQELRGRGRLRGLRGWVPVNAGNTDGCPHRGKLGRGGQEAWSATCCSGQSPSALGASRGKEAFPCARSPAAFQESCARPRIVLTARPGRRGRRGRRRGQTLCARPASCGYNSARLLGSNTPPTGSVDLLCHLLWTSDLAFPPNGPELLLPHW